MSDLRTLKQMASEFSALDGTPPELRDALLRRLRNFDRVGLIAAAAYDGDWPTAPGKFDEPNTCKARIFGALLGASFTVEMLRDVETCMMRPPHERTPGRVQPPGLIAAIDGIRAGKSPQLQLTVHGNTEQGRSVGGYVVLEPDAPPHPDASKRRRGTERLIGLVVDVRLPLRPWLAPLLGAEA